MSAPTTPVTDDAHATAAQLQQRAAQELAATREAAARKAAQGGTGARQGVLPGGGH
ncbi:hypothetical protein [Streptomyces turgidiscabies]|uniref:hypothetical protein n=1 Tax=Streptomyces turgidiscabies TaxID=85558 RepID=UPI0038F6A859